MRDCLHRIEGEVLSRLCPAERVQAHEERMLALDARATEIDKRLTILGEAVIETSKALGESRNALQQSASNERSERTLWLDQFSRLMSSQSQGITQAINLLADRVTDQGNRIDKLGGKLELVMKANEDLREHQENGLANAIATAVTSAVAAQVTGEANAHRIEVEADARLIEAQADAEARKNPWLLRLAQTKVAYLPLGGWISIAVFIFALAAIDVGLAQAILDWLRGLLK